MGFLFDEGSGDGGGGGIRQRVPPDVFVGANRNAAVAARNAALNANDVAEFDADPNLYIILRIGGVDTWQFRRAGAWRDTTNVARGPAGPPGESVPVRALEVKSTNSDRSSYGAGGYTLRQPLDDFFVVADTTEDHPIVELTVEAGREIWDLRWDGIEALAFGNRVRGTQSWTIQIGAGGATLWVRTRAA